ncbi:arginine--tRNA ligase [Alphaproteobacteria bacterium]|nr:arginine--tRNA ligase [Alphaproteobacteria bacterium]
MNIYVEIKNLILEVVKEKYKDLDTKAFTSINCEQPKNLSFGDVSSNVLMVVAKKLGFKSEDLKEDVITALLIHPIFNEITFIKPGFLNFKLKESYWFDLLNKIVQNPKYGYQDLGKGKKINLEFVSANPTGPLHVGHLRGAVFGDVLARLLERNGYDVTREYYVNDLGNQINVLLDTIRHHIINILNNTNNKLAEEMYQGAYLMDIAQVILKEKIDYKDNNLLKDWVTKKILDMIKSDLNALGITFDLFSSEKKIHDKGLLEVVLEKLEKEKFIYEGTLERPKGKEVLKWQPKEQLLFRSIFFGDTSDRPIKKNDGTWTYFASDIAYHHDKALRGFDEIINIWGADHAGYIKRVEGALKALGHTETKFTVKLCQIVNLLDNNKSIKMSKRSGNFILLKDITNKVGKDVIRFFMLIRKNDAQIDFDLKKCLEETKENPVFYIQYAIARINSLNKLVKEKVTNFNEYDQSIFKKFGEEELIIIKNLSLWPKVIEAAVTHKEPHRIVYYLIELASVMHNFWSMGKVNNKLKIINLADLELTHARLILLNSISAVIRTGLDIISVKPMEKM